MTVLFCLACSLDQRFLNIDRRGQQGANTGTEIISEML